MDARLQQPAGNRQAPQAKPPGDPLASLLPASPLFNPRPPDPPQRAARRITRPHDPPAETTRSDALREARSRVDIIGFAQSLGIEVNGKVTRCFIGTHPDRRPSLSFHTGRDGVGRWTCWSCGEHGDGVDMLRVVLGLSFREAAVAFCERAGINLPGKWCRRVKPDRDALRRTREKAAFRLWEHRVLDVLLDRHFLAFHYVGLWRDLLHACVTLGLPDGNDTRDFVEARLADAYLREQVAELRITEWDATSTNERYEMFKTQIAAWGADEHDG